MTAPRGKMIGEMENKMASNAELYEDARQKLAVYERIHASAGETIILVAAMRVINRHELVAEFVEELTKPKPE